VINLKEKSIVLVEFTGKEVVTGRVFDTTSEAVAKEVGLYKENAIFKPVPVIVGKGDILKGIDEALKEMNEGEERVIRLGPEKAFGERRKDLVVLVPLAEFTKRKIKPVNGLIVDINGIYGRVTTVSGGRVRVDMNNDLAGKEVEYKLKIIKEIKDDAEKVQVIAEKFFPLKEKAETKIEAGVIKVKIPKDIGKQLAPLVPAFTKTMKEIIPDLKSVEIVESFDAKPESEKKAKTEENAKKQV
jgi:FKBP-type peptidyl-prolyl cis-trans isomerase 2